MPVECYRRMKMAPLAQIAWEWEGCRCWLAEPVACGSPVSVYVFAVHLRAFPALSVVVLGIFAPAWPVDAFRAADRAHVTGPM